MMDFLWNLTSFVIALGILVTVHEYGHFWVARKNGVKVERFSVGFGKPLWRKIGKDGTEYILAMIPLGGYVKMLDERVDEVKPEDKGKTFNAKTVYQRIAIVAAGPLANFIFALIALYIMFLIGVPSVKPMIGDIVPSTIAAKANLPKDSEIISIAGKRTRDWQDVNLALIGQIGNKEITISTKKGDSQYISSVTLDTSDWQFSPDEMSALTSLGITPYRPKVHNELAAVAEGSPAELAGLLVGDKLIAVNDVLTDSWEVFAKEIKQYPNKDVAITTMRNGEILKLIVIPSRIEQAGKVIGLSLIHI